MDHQRPPHPPSSVPSAGKRLIAIDAIIDVIFSFSTPRTIIALSQTCRAAYPIAGSYFRVAYNPERFLQHFLPDPADVRAFRSLQAETGIVVYGQAVRKFLARAPLTDTAAEMVLSVDESYAPRVSEFLTEQGPGYDVENHKEESVFTKKGKDEQIVRQIVLRIGQSESFATIEKARDFPSEFTDVLTFDGAYSLFPAQYDKPIVDSQPLVLSDLPQPTPHPIYRSFSDRSSWVVSFDKANVVPPPQLPFGVSAPVRHPLYMSSWAFVWPKSRKGGGLVVPTGPQIPRGLQLRGIVLRSRLLKVSHVICCARLSQFVQQFLTRLVLAHPERSSLCFDNELAQFLKAVFERTDIRYGIDTYSKVWAIMKEMAPLPSDIPSAGGLQWPLPAARSKEYHFIPPV